MLKLNYEDEVREKFYENARKFNINTENSNILPFLEFVLNQKIEALGEINAIYKNFDVRESGGIFLDMEAFKLGLKREEARAAVIMAKINANGPGILFRGTVFSDRGCKFATKEDVKFDRTGKTTVEIYALKEGLKCNIEDGHLLFSDEYIKDFISLEVLKIALKGRDRESDSEFRTRLFKHIESFTLRDSKAYYETQLSTISEIKEAKIIRTPRGINSMDVVIRKINHKSSDERIIELAKEKIDEVLPSFVDVAFRVADEIEVKIKVKVKYAYLKDELKRKIKESSSLYFYRLKMGEAYKIYDLYSIFGSNVNILEPVRDIKPLEDQHFRGIVYFEDEK